MVDLVRGDVEASGRDDPNALDFGPDGAGCFASRVVDDLGLERLEALGYDTDTGKAPPTPLVTAALTLEERSKAYQSLETCLDLPAVLSQVFQRDAELPEAQADCVAMAYLESGLLESSLFSSAPDPELNADIDETLVRANETCAGAASP